MTLSTAAWQKEYLKNVERAWTYEPQEKPKKEYAHRKQVIQGKLYSTEVAKFVAHVGSQTYDTGKFEYWEGDLYITKKGNWFVSGYGNARSRFAREEGPTYQGGSGIIRIQHSDVIPILEDCNNFDALMATCQIEEG